MEKDQITKWAYYYQCRIKRIQLVFPQSPGPSANKTVKIMQNLDLKKPELRTSKLGLVVVYILYISEFIVFIFFKNQFAPAHFGISVRSLCIRNSTRGRST